MVGQLSRRVLLVDPEPFTRRVITGYLVAAGYVVRPAVDGLDALQKLRGGIPDLIISSLNMPCMSGAELLAIVRYRFPQIPVIILTGGPGSEEIPETLAADAYFQKDRAGFDDLVQSVGELTRRFPFRPALPVVEDKPIRAKWDGDGNYIVICKDCLRSFGVPRVPGIGRCERRVTCIHCRGAIQFLIDDPGIAEFQSAKAC